jgi:hypothetical protein
VATDSLRVGLQGTDTSEGQTAARRGSSLFRGRLVSRGAAHPATRMVLGVRQRSGPLASPADADRNRHLILRPRRLALQAPAATTACGAFPREASADIGPALRSSPDSRVHCCSARETERHPVPTMGAYHPVFSGGKAPAHRSREPRLFGNFDRDLLDGSPVERHRDLIRPYRPWHIRTTFDAEADPALGRAAGRYKASGECVE